MQRALAAAAGFSEPVAFINIGGVANLSLSRRARNRLPATQVLAMGCSTI
jgi:1,6-anhydro-N-acetylmuramate kinase